MIDSNRQFWKQSFFVLLVLLSMSIPLSRFTMSSFQFLLVLVWLLDGLSTSLISQFYNENNFVKAIYHTIKYFIELVASNLVTKFTLFLQNKTALIIFSIYALHIVGLIHTSDFDYALKDLRTKVPLFILPLMLASMPKPSIRQIYFLLLLYVLAVFGGTLVSFNEYLKQDFDDIRKISLFISPVRFGLNIVFSFFILLYFLFQNTNQNIWKQLAICSLMFWFVSFLILLESGIGIICIFVVGLGLLLYKVLSAKSLRYRVLMTFLFLTLPILAYVYVNRQVSQILQKPNIDFSTLDKKSKLGNGYLHDTINFGIEDGKFMGIYMATNEMADAWNKRSKYKFLGHDEANQLIQYTLIRYLTSKDLRKDAEGVNLLTDKDVHLIEKGIANVNYVENPSIKTRISKILLGYQRYTSFHDPNGSSVMQRIEHWKASIIIIKEHFWTGVGTGDIPAAFKETYERINSPLKEQSRWRAHNQYLSFWTAFGIFGTIWFIFVLLYLLVVNHNYKNYLFSVFWVIIIMSMFTEDTIETQDGVTFFTFFLSLFALWLPSKNSSTEDKIETK